MTCYSHIKCLKQDEIILNVTGLVSLARSVNVPVGQTATLNCQVEVMPNLQVNNIPIYLVYMISIVICTMTYHVT